MLLADLVLSDLPLEVLVALKHAINDEILQRKKRQYIARKVEVLNGIDFHSIKPPETYVEALEKALQENGSALFSLPSASLHGGIYERLRYLPCLLGQDWTFLFPNATTEEEIYYVYAHVDPRKHPVRLRGLEVFLKGSPFYIGKGCGARAADLKRNQGHGKIIKQIRDANYPDSSMWQIITDNLTEQAALILEAKLIYLFGSIYDETRKGYLLNLADHCKPQFLRGMSKLPRMKTYPKPDAEIANGS